MKNMTNVSNLTLSSNSYYTRYKLYLSRGMGTIFYSSATPGGMK